MISAGHPSFERVGAPGPTPVATTCDLFRLLEAHDKGTHHAHHCSCGTDDSNSVSPSIDASQAHIIRNCPPPSACFLYGCKYPPTSTMQNSVLESASHGMDSVTVVLPSAFTDTTFRRKDWRGATGGSPRKISTRTSVSTLKEGMN